MQSRWIAKNSSPLFNTLRYCESVSHNQNKTFNTGGNIKAACTDEIKANKIGLQLPYGRILLGFWFYSNILH